MSFSTFIALGDSITEGLSDRDESGNYVGWADRFASQLAQRSPSGAIQYQNLAVRGKQLQQMLDEQLEIAISSVVAQETLVSFYAGANNVLRPNYDPELTAALYEQAVANLVQSGARVVLFCIREITNPKARLQKTWNARFGPFNEMVRKCALKYECALVDPNTHEIFGDPRFVAKDRLHLSSLGHERLAQAVLVSLELTDDAKLMEPLPDFKAPNIFSKSAANIMWFITFVGPWMVRRISGRSSGDGRVAKYPQLVTWPIDCD